MKTPTANPVQIHQTVRLDHQLLELLNRDVQVIEKDHGLAVHKGVIIEPHLIEETVMAGDQGLAAEIGIGADDHDQVVETEIDGGGQDRVVKKDVDEHQDLAVQKEEVDTVLLQDSTEDHPQDTGMKNYT